MSLYPNFNFNKIIDNTHIFKLSLNSLLQKGNLVYEYNPFRNYRLTKTKYEVDGVLKDSLKPGEEHKAYIHKPGSIVDFNTSEFNFSIKNPVRILPLYSYDGSVNLVLNDGFNKPRLINSRFSSVGENKYLIYDRRGDDDNNLYDEGELFDIDTALNKITNNIIKLVIIIFI